MVRKINVLAGGWRKRAHETDQHRAFEATATRALANVPWTTDAWRDALAGRVVEHVLGRRVLPPAIANAMRSTVADIIRLETNLLRLPDTEPDDLLEAVAYRARLRALLTFKENSDRLFERWIDALGAILRAIADAVPSSSAPVHAASVLSAPLIDLIPKSTQLVTDLVARIMQFANDDPHAVRPGSVLAHLCKEALLTVSEIDETTARKHPRRLIAPNKSGLSGEALLEAFLPEPFHTLLSTPIPFQIPHHIYAEHGAIFSKSGHGKSQTLRAIVASLLQGEDPPALFIMDSLGALIEDIDKLQIFTTHLRDRLVIIDPADTRPPALNFFKLQSDDLIFYLFKSIDQSFTPRQSTMIAYLMELMRHIHDATLLTLVQVCESRDNLFPDVLAKLSPFAQSFFAQQFHAKKPDPFVQQTKNQIAQRIYSLGRMGKFAQMFSARENKFDPLRFMKTLTRPPDGCGRCRACASCCASRRIRRTRRRAAPP